MKWIKLDSIPSTNSHIFSMLRGGSVEEELVVLSDYQEAGRGQGGHSWHSQPGENLLMSMLLFPAFLSASEQFQISRLASVAICDILQSYGLDPVIKWPNDILVNGGKIAGILIEHGIRGTSISHSILGIGLNLNQSSFPSFQWKATSLVLENGKKADPHLVAKELTKCIMARYDLLKDGNCQNLEEEYLEHLYLRDQPYNFSSEGNEFEGIIRGVNPFGELLVDIQGEVKCFGHQEIQFQVSS